MPGGLNVYVVEVARRLAERGVEVDIFTRAVSREQPPVAELAPGVLVRHLTAGPFEDLDKSDLPGQLCQFTFELLRAEAAHAPGRYDLVHGHYWLSGQVGAVAKERWGVPLVQSMHTLGQGQERRAGRRRRRRARGPAARRGRGHRGRRPAGRQHRRRGPRSSSGCYDADPARWRSSTRAWTSRCSGPARSGRPASGSACPPTAIVLVFAGRVQPLKAPDVVLHAAARLIARRPGAGRPADRRVRRRPERHRPRRPGRADRAGRRAGPGRPGPARAAVPAAGAGRLVPGGHARDGAVLLESFGLVAVEAQACGTPVVAAAVGGLRTAVRDGVSGVLVDSRDPARYARAIARPDRRARPAGPAVARAPASTPPGSAGPRPWTGCWTSTWRR